MDLLGVFLLTGSLLLFILGLTSEWASCLCVKGNSHADGRAGV
jgi:hypothetical protein